MTKRRKRDGYMTGADWDAYRASIPPGHENEVATPEEAAAFLARMKRFISGEDVVMQGMEADAQVPSP